MSGCLENPLRMHDNAVVLSTKCTTRVFLSLSGHNEVIATSAASNSKPIILVCLRLRSLRIVRGKRADIRDILNRSRPSAKGADARKRPADPVKQEARQKLSEMLSDLPQEYTVVIREALHQFAVRQARAAKNRGSAVRCSRRCQADTHLGPMPCRFHARTWSTKRRPSSARLTAPHARRLKQRSVGRSRRRSKGRARGNDPGLRL